jgi:hypothetical protein
VRCRDDVLALPDLGAGIGAERCCDRLDRAGALHRREQRLSDHEVTDDQLSAELGELTAAGPIEVAGQGTDWASGGQQPMADRATVQAGRASDQYGSVEHQTMTWSM